MCLQLFYGNAVSGAQRFARPDLERRLLRILETSVGIKMFGLRRIGKSTLRRLATEHFDKTGRPYIFVDGQGLTSLGDLMGKLATGLPGDTGLVRRALGYLTAGPARTALEALAAGTPHEDIVLTAYWRLVSDAIKRALASDAAKPVLVIDEFSHLIDNMARHPDPVRAGDADRLLASMREWRDQGMTMLLTGSIGFNGLARRSGLNAEHLNDLQPFSVPELTEGEARAFIRRATETPSQGQWTDDHTDAFLAQSGVLYPSFLVRGLLELDIEDPVAPQDFGAIFAEKVRPHLHDDFYRQFNRRFHSYRDLPNGEQQELILPALKAVMEAPSPCPQDGVACPPPFTRVDLAFAFEMLAEDGFIHVTETADGARLWRPASRLARLWWIRAGLT